ncbi:hypothetical protein OIV83_006265 [Microbotryomycetes sp. JL201]|nr:hypothetical protein OIV83_006265 [Microbotryomycetes sp. JL201]
MEAVHTRTPRWSDDGESATVADVSDFDPLAVPSADGFSSIAASLDRVQSRPPTATIDTDLIALGEEQLFSGTRTRAASRHCTNDVVAAGPDSFESPPAQLISVSDEQLGTLESARAAFALALQSLLEQTRAADPNSLSQTLALDGPDLHSLVSSASPNMSSDDAYLAQSLLQLLSCIDRLTLSSSLTTNVPGAEQGSSSQLVGVVEEVQAAERDLLWGRIDDLSEQVKVLGRRRMTTSPPEYAPDRSEEVEQLGDSVLPAWKKEHEPSVASADLPRYAYESDSARPPAYLEDTASIESLHEKKDISDSALSGPGQFTLAVNQRQRVASFSEKTRRDLDGVTKAIERLYVVSPQLANQRADQDRRQLRERQLAKLGNAIERLSKGRFEDQRASPALADDESERRARDRLHRIHADALDHLVDQIDRAASRTLADQRVELKGKQRDALNALTMRNDASANVETSSALSDLFTCKQFEPLSDAFEAKRREFILEHTGKGRLASQDAVLTKAAHVSDVFPHSAEADAPISLQTFLESERELPIERAGSPSKKSFSPFKTTLFGEAGKSAPRWGRRGSWDVRITESFPKAATARRGSYDSRVIEGTGSKRNSLHERRSKSLAPTTVHHVAEELCNLASVTITFWTSSSSLSSSSAVVDESWQVLFVDDQSVTVGREGDWQTFKLELPCRVPPQQSQVISRGDTHQVKLSTVDASPTRMRHDLEINVPYSTAMLRELKPSVIACATCQSTLIEGSKLVKYNALPSEHWAELLEAWMCHKDQELSDDLVAKGKGIRPRENEALVGSAFIVIDSILVSNYELNSSIKDERSADNHILRPIRCTTCESMIGFEDIAPEDGDQRRSCVRLHKYATQITSLAGELPVVAVDVYVATAILELSQAHACHRFVLADYEQEQPYVYIWLFNPFIRVCSGLNRDADERPRAIRAVKVMYLVHGPASSAAFEEMLAQSSTTYDTLQYPRSIIDKLCMKLRDSTEVYPVSQRTFGSFEVGFLERL